MAFQSSTDTIGKGPNEERYRTHNKWLQAIEKIPVVYLSSTQRSDIEWWYCLDKKRRKKKRSTTTLHEQTPKINIYFCSRLILSIHFDFLLSYLDVIFVLLSQFSFLKMTFTPEGCGLKRLMDVLYNNKHFINSLHEDAMSTTKAAL